MSVPALVQPVRFFLVDDQGSHVGYTWQSLLAFNIAIAGAMWAAWYIGVCDANRAVVEVAREVR